MFSSDFSNNPLRKWTSVKKNNNQTNKQNLYRLYKDLTDLEGFKRVIQQ